MKELLNSVRIVLRTNWWMTGAVLALLTIGIFFIYSASSANEAQAAEHLYRKQIVWAIVGLGCYVAFAMLDYRRLRKLAWWVYLIALVLLVVVLVVGDRRFGAKRWLSLFGMNLQPSEIAKMGLIFVLARRLSRPGVNLGHFRPLAMALLIAAVPFVLILEEPDLGTGLILAPTAFAMMFVAGVPARALVLLVMTGVAAAGIFLGVLFLPARLGLSEVEQQKIMKMIRINQYQKTRIEVFLNLDTDPFGAGWNKRQSGISVGSGGAWGKGFLNGTQNILGYLPRSVAPTDFIYAVIAEEKGFAGSIAVLVLFSVIAAVGIAAALMAHDKFGRLLCVGIVCMIFGHVFINMAMTVGLMPITGLPLPLLSYGGSFMVITMSALGIVQSVYVRSRQVPVVFEQVGLWKTG